MDRLERLILPALLAAIGLVLALAALAIGVALAAQPAPVQLAAGFSPARRSAMTEADVQRPPARFHGHVIATIGFADEDAVDAACGQGAGTSGGRRILACAGNGAMIMPNPCGYPGYYAALLCHEMSHLNGWRHERS